ncbi:CLUMA_CG008912, isoform A [Clunio marinus]|uniref:CLUMA_CG008912, isoform A n=1 Tax=Clunio marinus TaxID=568069 RepID=A0A1J1I6D5_9DIPT|nr:CLUMA_CG008912, isoform A [Clunio marinus]
MWNFIITKSKMQQQYVWFVKFTQIEENEFPLKAKAFPQVEKKLGNFRKQKAKNCCALIPLNENLTLWLLFAVYFHNSSLIKQVDCLINWVFKLFAITL